MRIFLRDGKEHEIPEEWIKYWEELHYNVTRELMLAVQWSADHVSDRKTKRGLRAFLGNWVRRKCPIRPVERPKQLIEEQVQRLPKERAQEHLAKLKELVK